MKKSVVAILVTLFLLLTLIFSSCNASSGSKNYYDRNEGGMDTEPGASDDVTVKVDGPSDRKIIKTVRQTMRTREYEAFCANLESALSAAGGYVSSSRYYNRENVGYRSADFVLRIPASALDAFLTALGEKGSVVSYQDETDDVTLAYVDVESRIAVLAAEESALLRMLEESVDTTTLLAVRKQLSETQSELASLRAQKRTYDDLIAYSTLYLSLEEADYVPATADPSFFGAIGQNFVNSLYSIGRGFRGFGIWLFGRSPYILFFGGIIAGVFFLLRHLLRRRSAGKNGQGEQEKKV